MFTKKPQGFQIYIWEVTTYNNKMIKKLKLQPSRPMCKMSVVQYIKIGLI